MKLSLQAQQGILKLEQYKQVLEDFGTRSADANTLYSVKIDRGGKRYSLGEQVRHVLDYYGCLIRGFHEVGDGPYEDKQVKVDYINRERDQSIEENIMVAIRKIDELIEEVRSLCSKVGDGLLVHHRNNAAKNSWYVTDFGTQLQINWVHAVHHAEQLIAVIQTFFGDFEFPENFEMDVATINKLDSMA